MKKISLVLLTALCLCVTSTVFAKTNKAMKISYNGEVKFAKDIGEGKGINIVLPELDSEGFYINAIELAVFEKQETESEWHIYKNDRGKESKKQYIESPQSLNVSVDFGEVSDYRDRAKYKLAYRYYVRSVDDMSRLCIAGEDIKDGWRMIGEENPVRATDDGFMFYVNTNPELSVRSFQYKKHRPDRIETITKTPDELEDIRLPLNAFSEGVTVNYIVNDYDQEDEITVKYVLIDAENGTVLSSGYLDQSPVIKADVACDSVKLKLTACDDFGGETDTDWFIFNIDKQKPFVADQFDDMGHVLMGNNLFSDFTIYDDSSELMTDGIVFASIRFGNVVVDNAFLEHIGNGVYRLDSIVEQDGKYTVELDIYDSSGNNSKHTFYQTLDATIPTIIFQQRNPASTKYSTWMNESKLVFIEVSETIAGLSKYTVWQDQRVEKEVVFTNKDKATVISVRVRNDKTGKLKYTGEIYDCAKAIDKSANKADETSKGNLATFEKYVWLDKTPPVIECDVDETVWYERPKVFNINFSDVPSSPSVDDVSGIATTEYAVTSSAALPTQWNEYTGVITINTGGVFYLHLRAVDNAGNIATLTKKVKINTVSTILGRVEPTDDYLHTIYYRDNDFYVVKNTAYNTKYHFRLIDTDISDSIRTTVKLVSKDNPEIYASSSSVTYPNGNPQRDVVFNMPYIDDNDNKLPDGVYEMLVSISEVKNDGEVIKTHDGVKVAEVVIKRTAPPTPIITVSGGTVEITYPDETVAPSLNNAFVLSKYMKQYKIVKNGVDVSGYVNYTESFPAEDMTVTALYTDIAGNISVATKRIFDTDADGDSSGIDPTVEGSNTTVEESRAGNVYYIGIRREKQKGINSDIFNFID